MQNAYDALSAAAQLLQQLSGWKETEPSTLERAILSSSHCTSIVCHDKLSKFRLETKAEHPAFVLLKCKGFFFQIPLSLQCTEAPTAHQGQSALPHGAEETPCAPGGKAFQSLTDKGTCIQNSSISRPPNQPPSFEKKFGNKTSQSHLILHQKIWVCRLSRNSVSLRTASSTAPVCSPDVGRDLGKDDIDGRFAAGQGRVHALRGARQRLLRHLRDLESYRKIVKPTITQLNTGKNRRDT